MKIVRARKSSKTGNVFVIEKYYYTPQEECPDTKTPACQPETPSEVIKNENIYHCAKCHKNVIVSKPSNVRYSLKLHYLRNPGHSLSHPPRSPPSLDFASLPEGEKLTVAEGMFSYLAVTKGVPFKLFKVFSPYIRKCFNPNFLLGPRKCAAIATNVFGKRSENILSQELAAAKFITISFDASIHMKQNLFTIFATFFQDNQICHRLLDITILPDEKAATATGVIKSVIQKYKIAPEKIVAICADNCATNYGSVHRTGPNNVFALLKIEYGEDKLVGIGCLAHIIHNSLKEACNGTKTDVGKMIYKAEKYFAKEPVRVKNYTELSLALGLGRNPDLPSSYVLTRWLSMKRALEKMIGSFRLLRSYFNSLTGKLSKDEQELKKFFSSQDVLPWLIVLYELAEEFEQTVISIEGDDISLLSSIAKFDELKEKMRDREISDAVNEHIDALPNAQNFRHQVRQVYDNVFGYMESRSQWTASLKTLNWINLDKELSVNDICTSTKILENLGLIAPISAEVLAAEVDQINETIENQLTNWTQKRTPIIKRWNQVLNSVIDSNIIQILLQYAFAMPGTNATCERLFSHVKYYWTKWKSSLKRETLVSVMKIRFNLNADPEKVFNLLVTDENLRHSVRNSDKYKTVTEEEHFENEHSDGNHSDAERSERDQSDAEHSERDHSDEEHRFSESDSDVFSEEFNEVHTGEMHTKRVHSGKVQTKERFNEETYTEYEPSEKDNDDEVSSSEEESSDDEEESEDEAETVLQNNLTKPQKRQSLGTPTPIKNTSKKTKSANVRKALDFSDKILEETAPDKISEANKKQIKTKKEYSSEELEKIKILKAKYCE